MIDRIPQNILRFISLILLQTLLLNSIQFSGLNIHPYIYILYILLLPFETPSWLLLLMAFILGLIVDAFTNTMGEHAAASVFVAFLRPFVLELISSREGYEVGSLPRLSQYGFVWFVKYTIFLIIPHHLLYFFLDAFTFSYISITFLKIILTAIFSTFIIILSQFLVFKK